MMILSDGYDMMSEGEKAVWLVTYHMTYEEDRTMKKYLMMLAAGLLTVSLGGCAAVTDSTQTDSAEVEEVSEEAEDYRCEGSSRQRAGRGRDRGV